VLGRAQAEQSERENHWRRLKGMLCHLTGRFFSQLVLVHNLFWNHNPLPTISSTNKLKVAWAENNSTGYFIAKGENNPLCFQRCIDQNKTSQ